MDLSGHLPRLFLISVCPKNDSYTWICFPKNFNIAHQMPKLVFEISPWDFRKISAPGGDKEKDHGPLFQDTIIFNNSKIIWHFFNSHYFLFKSLLDTVGQSFMFLLEH